MNQQKYKALFMAALERTRALAEEQLGKALPHELQFVYQGPPVPGVLTDTSQVFAGVWLDEERFYQWIDLLVTGYSDSWTRVMVTISSRPPVSFFDTWDPTGYGPFKPIGADTRLWKKSES